MAKSHSRRASRRRNNPVVIFENDNLLQNKQYFIYVYIWYGYKKSREMIILKFWLTVINKAMGVGCNNEGMLGMCGILTIFGFR